MAELTTSVNMRSITIKVRLPRALPARILVGKKLILLAATTIIGCGIIFESETPDAH